MHHIGLNRNYFPRFGIKCLQTYYQKELTKLQIKSTFELIISFGQTLLKHRLDWYTYSLIINRFTMRSIEFQTATHTFGFGNQTNRSFKNGIGSTL